MKTKKKKALSILTPIAAAILLMSNVNGCGDRPVNSITKAFQTSKGSSVNQCGWIDPASNVKKLKSGELRVFVKEVGGSFSWTKFMRETSSHIDCILGTKCCVNANFPENRQFTLGLYYIERNLGACADATSGCHFWRNTDYQDIYPDNFLQNSSCADWIIPIDDYREKTQQCPPDPIN